MHRSEELLTKVLTNTSLSDRIFSWEAELLSNQSQSWLFFLVFFLYEIKEGDCTCRRMRGEGDFFKFFLCEAVFCSELNENVAKKKSKFMIRQPLNVYLVSEASFEALPQICHKNWHSAPSWPGIVALKSDTRIYLCNLVVQAQLCQCRFPHYKWISGIFQSYRSNLEVPNRPALTALQGGFTTSEVARGLRVDMRATLTNNERALCLISPLDSALIASSPICVLEQFVIHFMYRKLPSLQEHDGTLCSFANNIKAVHRDQAVFNKFTFNLSGSSHVCLAFSLLSSKQLVTSTYLFFVLNIECNRAFFPQCFSEN